MKAIENLYLDVMPEARIAKMHGVSRAFVRKRLVAASIAIRSRSETARLMAAQCSAEERKSRAMAANCALRGSKNKELTLLRRALFRSTHITSTRREAMWIHVIEKSGFKCVPQMQFHIYNADIAIPSAKVVVEVQNGWHNFKKGRAFERDKRKKICIEKLGWHVVYIFDRQLGGQGELALLDMLCVQKRLYSSSSSEASSSSSPL